jgi:pimeloyl-ACP methyl ester carboxylesterase
VTPGAAPPARRRSIVVTALALLVVTSLLAVGACSASAPRPVVEEPGGTPAVSTPSGPSFRAPQDYCSGVPVPAGAQQRVVTAPEGSAINTVWLGSGPRTAVLLHQTDGNGLCGMLFYAAYLAAHGVRTVSMDLCGYGQSFCQLPGQQDPILAVTAVVDALRADGARRVALVGASMGGSLAVHAGARVGADVVVDLSGPASFNTSDIKQDAPTITMPILIAFGKATDPTDLKAVQSELAAMPTTKKQLVRYPAGHGVDLLLDPETRHLTPLAGKVLSWVQQA